MTRESLIKTIQTELEKLNMRIDLKIIRGLAYAKEARRHKFLSAQLTHLQLIEEMQSRPKYSGWLQKSASFASMFMF